MHFYAIFFLLEKQNILGSSKIDPDEIKVCFYVLFKDKI